MKSNKKHIFLFLMCAFICLTITACTSLPYGLDKEHPTAITIWHYYNGVQKQLFDQLVTQFNETEGLEKGIVVEAINQGSVNELTQKILDAASQKVGAQNPPEMFAGYADTVFQLKQQNKVADISKYLTDAERSEYIDAYLQEGNFFGDGSLYIFPVAKATEVLMLNQTDWEPFAQATGADEADLATWEGIARIAASYYQWSDSLTEAPEDGKAFFGRDAMANYLLVGCMQLGSEMFTVKNGIVSLSMDKQAMRRLWDNYYVPYINGYFASFGRFRSDDVKTGDLIALVGSTAGATYFPTEVTLTDGSTYPIKSKTYPAPNFEGTNPWAVQQGAGMAILSADEKAEYAAVTFLKWFTAKEQNVAFSAASGYMPVKKATSTLACLQSAVSNTDGSLSGVVQEVLEVGLHMTETFSLYTNKAFQGGNDARSILEESLSKKAAEDRTKVQNRMAQGLSRAEAVALYDTDENYLAWYAALYEKLEEVIQRSNVKPNDIK